jgi:hypothetical protein
MVRALKAYLAQEGRQILKIALARNGADNGEGTDADDEDYKAP